MRRRKQGRIKVAFDLDGCLVDLRSVICQEFNAWTGKQLTVPDIDVYDLEGLWELKGMDYSARIEAVWRRWREVDICDGAGDLLHKLYELTGDPPRIVTSRDSFAASDTHALVDRFLDIPYILIFSKGDKQRFLKEYPFMVEDKGSEAISLTYSGKTVFLCSQPYNQGFKNSKIHRINGVKDLFPILSLLVEEGE